MKSPASHPARSPEFLSRLHDGELDPAERARFEAHRAHCAECREAAAQFEAALAFFRSTRTRPAPADLSARILSKLQRSGSRRSPLGHSFGIDLKWAGAFVAALIAVIVGSSIVTERESRRRAELREAPITVTMQESPPPAVTRQENAAPEKRASALASDRERARFRANKPVPLPRAESPVSDKEVQTPERKTLDEAIGRLAAEYPARTPDARPSGVEARRGASPRAISSRTTASRDAASAPPPSPSELAGGEAGSPESAATLPSLIRVRVVAAPDVVGSIPQPSNAAALALTGADRGSYVFLVRADGTVSSVRRSTQRSNARGENAAASAPNEELRKLRFPAGDRPRHLIVAVE